MGAYDTYDDVRARLDEIVDAVNAEGVTLDEALALYEEAVKLGLLACDLSEEDAQALVSGEAVAAGEGASEAAKETAGADLAKGTAAGEGGSGAGEASEAKAAVGDAAASAAGE